jgi:Major Facilitator Superfamily
MSLFRRSSFTGVSIVAFCLSAGMFAMFLYLTLYIQGVLALSPLEAGLRFLPLTLLSFFVAPISARLSNRVPFPALMGTGMLLAGIGLVLMHGIEVGDSWTGLLPGFVLAGIGVGMTNPGIASVAIGVVAPARAGMASGINSTFRQVGVATGVAALGAVFQSRVAARLGESLPQAPHAFADAVSSGASEPALRALAPALRERAASAADQAFVSGFNEILLGGAAIVLLGSLAAWLLVRSRDLVAHVGVPEEAIDPDDRSSGPVLERAFVAD